MSVARWNQLMWYHNREKVTPLTEAQQMNLDKIRHIWRMQHLGFSDWADGTPLVKLPPKPTGPYTDLSGNVRPEWQRYETLKNYNFQLATAAPAIEVARLQTEAARVTAKELAPAQAAALRMDSASLSNLRAAEGFSNVLRARTKNLKTTAEVSQQVQQPVKAEAIKALPWVIGGAVALGLLGVILYRTKK